MPYRQIVIEMSGLNRSCLPGLTFIAAQSLPSFEYRSLPAITLADLNRWGGGSRAAAGQGDVQTGLT